MPLLEWYLTKGQPDTKVEQISSWPEVIPLLATRCLYWGLNMTKGHPNPRPDQISSSPEVIPLLTTRCLYQGWGVMSNQSSTWPKVWPNVKLTWSSTTLDHEMPQFWGYIWPKVSLTQKSKKNFNLTWSLIYGSTSGQWSAWHKG